MDEYDLFDKAMNYYENQSNATGSGVESKSDISQSSSTDVCKHVNYNKTEEAMIFCLDCGEEIEKTIIQDKEWRYYGQSDNRRGSDPNRVIARKNEERNIFKDVERMGFGDKVVHLANQIYIQVTHDKIYRGNSRKSIIFASVFHAFKLYGKPQCHDKLIKIFNLDRKLGLKGLKHVNLNAPKNSPIHTTHITPENLIEDIMDKFKATTEQKKEVFEIYLKIKNKSSRINRSRPQSTASAITYFWICFKKIDITLKEFAKKSELSELTIERLSKEIARIMGVDIRTLFE
jgi:transcription initiation factor TFIIIB Brf1 subunit/transcription initiation factor TFIIB